MQTQQYLDFVLRVDKGDGQSYPVSVLSSPAGEESTTMQLPLLSDDWQTRLSIVANARGGNSRSSNVSSVQADPLGLAYTKKLGEDLFGALINGPVLSCFEASRHQAKMESKGLRIRLRIQAPDLAALPWEYLIDSRLQPLALSRQTPIVRHMEMASALPKLRLQPPIRILGMIGDHQNLDVAEEQKLIGRAIEHLNGNGTMTLDWVPGHTWRHLQRALQKGEYHVFHFIGHGIFDPISNTGKLLLNSDDGKSQAFDSSDLGRLLAEHSSIRLAVLNSCEGAKSSQASLFSSTGAILASHGVPAIVSMQYAISDRAALEFSRAFYDQLSDGIPVETAVSIARQSIKMALGDTVEWGTPVLHLRAVDGLLFEVDDSSSLGLSAASERPSQRMDPVPSAPASVAGPLASFASTVRSFWIDSVLQKKLDQSARLDLGLDLMAGEVISAYGIDKTLTAVSPGQVLSELGNLLVLGDPGSGKTVALLELARALLNRFAAEPLAPVPVIFNLSSWVAKKDSLMDWMAAELKAKYPVPKSLAYLWLEQKRLFPLLDGLDEVSQEARTECAEVINKWLASAHQTGVVVCCRTKEYCDLPVKLTLNGAVRLKPLTRDQVINFLDQAGEPLAELRSLLERDSGLLIDARSPLMLALMVRAYRGLKSNAAELHCEQGIAARRKMVMDAYVRRELDRAREGGLLV